MAQQYEPPLGVQLLSDMEAVVEFSERIDLQRTITWMSPLQFWLGKKVHLTCRPASPEEVEHARKRDEEEERGSHHDTQEERIIRMMEDIHRLATNPGGRSTEDPDLQWNCAPTKE